MANEWTAVDLYGANNDGGKRRFTIADGLSVSKGQLLILSDPRTVTAVTMSAVPQMYAGVASEEHKANLGVTSIAVWTDGIFEAVASGAINAGSYITGADQNKVIASGGLIVSSGANLIGYSFELAADAETINVRLDL